MTQLNVLITHVSYQAAAGSFIKLLRKSNKFRFYIVGCDILPKGYSSGSMLVDKYYHIQCEVGNSEYISNIEHICTLENIDLIISAEEDDLRLYKKHCVPQALYKHIPDDNIFELFKDKHRANLSVQNNGIEIPKTLYGYQEFCESKTEKIIFRQRISCCSRGIEVMNKHEVNRCYSFFSDHHITQEYITGEFYTIDMFCDKQGIPHLIIPRRKKEKKDGTDFKCVVERKEQLISLCNKIYRLYKIPGISNIQFIVQNEHAYFIELNPRAAATVIASSLTSVNFLDLYISHFYLDEPLQSYEDLMGEVFWGSVISRYYQETVLYGRRE